MCSATHDARYHSHPGFGCWLSPTDVNTALSFERLNERSVAVVVDPIQSVKGKIVIDAFRTMPRQAMALNKNPRQTTSHIGFLNKPNARALMRGLNRTYYSINIDYRKDERVEQMLLNLRRTQWHRGFDMKPFKELDSASGETMRRLVGLSKKFSEDILEEVRPVPAQCFNLLAGPPQRPPAPGRCLPTPWQ